MPSPSPDEPRRRARRAVRPAGTVGGDEANLRSSFPAPAPDDVAGPSDLGAEGARPAAGAPPTTGAPTAGAPTAGVAQAAGAPGAGPRVFPRAPDDEDVGWGAPAVDSNDDRLARDRPPHW